MAKAKNAVCPSCKEGFHCGKDAVRCWCMDEPPAPVLDKEEPCVCPECLRGRGKKK